jgi:hypothetical protein
LKGLPITKDSSKVKTKRPCLIVRGNVLAVFFMNHK